MDNGQILNLPHYPPTGKELVISRSEFNNGLRLQLVQGYDPIRIARWAYDLHVSARAFEDGLKSDLLMLIAMDMGEEYEIEETKLWELAAREG